MERLTQRSTWDGGVYFTKKPKGFFCYENPCSQAVKCEKVDDKTCPHLAILERLAEYEDTGLDPESVEQMQDVFGRGITFVEDAMERLEIIEGISTGRLRELADADRDGRYVVLPFKPPKVVWTCSPRFPKPGKADYQSAVNVLSDMERGYVFGDTPEAAEAALKGDQDG